MRATPSLFWGRSFILLTLLQFCDCRVNTEAQMGPLYRVVGGPLSISCNASGTPSGRQTDFQYTMIRPPQQFSINIISTNDPSFGFAAHARRVKQKEITLTHVGESSVLFEIKSLLAEDAGEYECISVSTNVVLDGVYSSKTTVKVIGDSLDVSLSEPPSVLKFNEGEAFSLTCQATSNTIQHTHLSLAWLLRKDGQSDAEPIISLSRDFTLIPGQNFEQRYKEGHVSLEKLGQSTYRLKISELQVSDRGHIYCQAKEWTQDPDRSWFPINQKDTEAIPLIVEPREVGPDMSALVVRVSAEESSLLEGHKLSLTCSIDTPNLKERFFSVAWYRGSVELARIGPTGILFVTEYSAKEQEGHLRATRVGHGNYHLTLDPMTPEDQGTYVCRAWPETRESDGTFTKGAAQDSNSQEISVSIAESTLSVEMQPTTVSVNQPQKLKLECKVKGIMGRLLVTWERNSHGDGSAFAPIISLDQDGVVRKKDKFAARQVRVVRLETDSFIFELDGMAPSDSGQYRCVVSESVSNGDPHSLFATAAVTVVPVASLVKVTLRNRNSNPPIGEETRLICKVAVQDIPITLIWMKQSVSSDPEELVKLSHNGEITWLGNQKSYQVNVRRERDFVNYELKIVSASQSEEGTYRCQVTTLVDNANVVSNGVGVKVEKPESKLSLSSSPSLKQNINTDIHIRCSVVSSTNALKVYNVSWVLQQEGRNRTILSMDRNAFVTYGNEVELSTRGRISMMRNETSTFELIVRQGKVSDTGSYFCKVTEWLQDPQQLWVPLSTVATATDLVVAEPDANLSIEESQKELNVSRQEWFTLPCHIGQQSSPDSQFQVTWFWQKDEAAEKQPIFTAHRDSTIKSSLEEGDLKFDHPSHNHFSLRMQNLGPDHSGLYFCEVEEWLLSLPREWRKISVMNSENINVTIRAEGIRAASSSCMSSTFFVPAIVVVIVLLLVVAILAIKICRTKVSKDKRHDNNFWAGQPLHEK